MTYNFNILSSLMTTNKNIVDLIDSIKIYSDIYDQNYIIDIINSEIASHISDDLYTEQKYAADNTDEVSDSITYSETSTEISVRCPYINSSVFKAESLSAISSIYLEDSVQYIHNSTFKGLKNLHHVHLPANMKIIQSHMFEHCSSLEDITLPNNLIIIGNSAFKYCTNLSIVNFNDKLKIISEDSFSYCPTIHTLKLPNNLAILCNAFCCCGQIDALELSENIRCILPHVFSGTIIKSLASNEEAILKKFSHAFKKYKILKTLDYI